MIARRLVLAATLSLAACAAPSSEPRSPSSTSSPATPSKESIAAPPPPVPASGGAMPGTAAGTSATDATPPTSTGAAPTGTGGEAKPTVPQPPTAPPPYPTPTPTPVDDVPHAQAKFEESAQLFTNAGTDCSKMCKALASMERAAGHLCDLVKDGVATDKKKCTDAKARLDHARDRVMSTCGGCD